MSSSQSNITRKPGAVTQILKAGNFDPREYLEKAGQMIERAPEQALRVIHAVIGMHKNDADAWAMLFKASMKVWAKLSSWKKFWRSVGLKLGLPKSDIKIGPFMTDHVGLVDAWKKLQARFEHDDVMQRTIALIIVKIAAIPRHQLDLAHLLIARAIKEGPGSDRDNLYATAIYLANTAADAQPQDQGLDRERKAILASATSANYQDVANEREQNPGKENLDGYRKLLASVYQPSNDAQIPGMRRIKLG